MIKKLALLSLLLLFIFSCEKDSAHLFSKSSNIEIIGSIIANKDTISIDAVADPQEMPTLNDTTDFEKLRNYLIDLNSFLDENRDLRNSIFPKFGKLCPIYFDMYREKQTHNTTQFYQIFDDLPEKNTANYFFLKKLVTKADSSLLAHQKPLGAVFQGITEETSIFETNANSRAERIFLEMIEGDSNTTIEATDIFNSRTSFPLDEKIDSVYVFTETNSYKTSVNDFNYKTEDCKSYYFFELGQIDELSATEEILISSPYNLELEFNNNEELDKMLYEKFQAVCADCPSSRKYQKTFAQLKDYENYYFTYTREPGKETDDTYVPVRSLIYYDGDLLYTVWSTNIDLFGCSCL